MKESSSCLSLRRPNRCHASESKSALVDDGNMFPVFARESLVRRKRDAELCRRKSRLERGVITAFVVCERHDPLCIGGPVDGWELSRRPAERHRPLDSSHFYERVASTWLLPSQPRLDLSTACLAARRNLGKGSAGHTTVRRTELPVVEDIDSVEAQFQRYSAFE